MFYPYHVPQAPATPPQDPAADVEELRRIVIERIREEAYRLENDLGMPAEAEKTRKQIPIVRAMSGEEVVELCRTLDLGGA